RPSDAPFAPSRPSSHHAAAAYGPATTMQSAGAIETAPRSSPPARSLRVRIGLISTVALTVIGGASPRVHVVGRGSGGDAGPARAPDRAKPTAPARAASPGSAPAPASPDAAPAYEPTLPTGAVLAEPAGEGSSAEPAAKKPLPRSPARKPPVRPPPPS